MGWMVGRSLRLWEGSKYNLKPGQAPGTDKWGSEAEKAAMSPKGKKWMGRPNYPKGKSVSLFIYLNQAQLCQSVNSFMQERTELVVKTTERIKKE